MLFRSAIDQIWGGKADEASFTTDYMRALAHQKDLEAYVNALEPSTDQQRAAKAAALAAAGAVGQSRTQMVFAVIEPVAYALVTVVVGWATLLFCGYGLLSKLHPMSLVSLTFGALAIGSAIYCIVDMSSPFDGLFQSARRRSRASSTRSIRRSTPLAVIGSLKPTRQARSANAAATSLVPARVKIRSRRRSASRASPSFSPTSMSAYSSGDPSSG